MGQIIQCPYCSRQYTAAEEQMGTQIACDGCGNIFVAGGAAAAAAFPAVAADPANPWPTATPVPYAAQPQSSSKAIASMVLGIVSICTCILYGIPSLVCGILAVVFGGTARKMIATGQMPPSAAGQARAGRICGIIGIVLSVLYWVVLVVAYSLIAQFGPQGAGQPNPFGP